MITLIHIDIRLESLVMEFNYNLLKPLALLLENQSITETAKQMSTSTSAVSRTLKTLREIFKDELLIRKNSGMELTPKAVSLRPKVNAIVNNINSLSKELSFEPLTAQLELNIAMNGYIANWLAPAIIQYLSQYAPNIKLTIEDWNELTPERINTQRIHCGIHYFPLDLNKNLIQRKIGEDKSVIVCRKDHPIVDQPITMETVASYPLAIHLQKHWNERQDQLSKLLQNHGIDFNVKLKTTHVNVIINALETTDLLFPCSIYLAKQLDERLTYITSNDEKLSTIQNKEFAFICDKTHRGAPFMIWLQNVISNLMKNMPQKLNQ